MPTGMLADRLTTEWGEMPNDTPVDLPRDHRLPLPLPVGRMYHNVVSMDPTRKNFGRPVKKASRKGKNGLNKSGHRGNPHKR